MAACRWRFAVPILRTLINDIPIMLGVYALSGREVSAATVAAVLTILGYSVYDTIIVFDRVRENMPLMQRQPFWRIANISLWETMRRSLATTFITLLPIVSLLLFGGETLKDFAFALFIGIGLGAAAYEMTIGLVLVVVWASVLYFSIERPGKAWLRAAFNRAYGRRSLPTAAPRATAFAAWPRCSPHRSSPSARSSRPRC